MADEGGAHLGLLRLKSGGAGRVAKLSSCSRGGDFWGLLTNRTTVNLYFRFVFPVQFWRFQ